MRPYTAGGAPKKLKRKAGPEKPKSKPAAEVKDVKVQVEFKPAKKALKRKAIIQAEVKDTKSAADRGRAPAYIRSRKNNSKVPSAKGHDFSALPPDLRQKANLRVSLDEGRSKAAGLDAPVLKVLEQTTRPLHAIAGAAEATIQGLKPVKITKGKPLKPGPNPLKAAWKGLKNEEKKTFSDAIKATGYKGPGIGTTGFVMDLFADPLTYATGGTASVARSAATKAAAAAEKKALAKGLTAAQAKKMGERAHRQTLKKAAPDKGITVKFAGKEVPGVTKATAKAGKVAKRVTDVKGVRTVKVGFRKAGSDIRPGVTPVGLSEAEHETIRQAARTARAGTSKGAREAQNRALALRDKIGPANYTRVIDAIEAGKIGSLPDELREAAVFFRSQMRHTRRLERQAGIPVAKRENYVPHVPILEATEVRGVSPSKTVSPSFAKGRKEQRTLREIRQASTSPVPAAKATRTPVVAERKAEVRYSEDLPQLYAKRLTEGTMARAKSDFNQRIANLGTTIKRGDTVAPAPHEAIYHVSGPNIRKVDVRDPEIQKVVDTGASGKGGRYVILNQKAIDRAYESIVPLAGRSTLGENFDKMQAIWKWIATQPNPGFHLRNFVGDMQNAYTGQPGLKLLGNTKEAAKTLKRVGTAEKAQRTTLDRVPADTEGLQIGGRHITYADLADEAERVGAIRSGFRRELRDLSEDPSKVKPQRGGKVRAAVSRSLQNREDLFRMATYIHARKEGFTPEQAAARMADRHFDYADLTKLERTTLRRIMPFYTFSARNIPLQFKVALTRPGKFAQYQKVREEVAKAFGLDLDATENDMAEYERRGAPLVIKWKGEKFTLGLGPSGLPLTDLNEFPVRANPAAQVDEWINRGMSLVTPAIKSPVELWANISFFFRDEIERESGPLVPAPSYVKLLPDDLKKALHVTDSYVDKRSGKKGWGWSAKADYVAAQFSPGPLGYLKRTLTQSERKQTTFGGKTLAYVGLRATPIKAVDVRVQETYEERQKVGKKLAELRQQANPANGDPISADNPTPEYSKLLRRHKELTDRTAQLRQQRGDKMVPKRGRPKKTRVVRRKPTSSGGFLGGSSSSSSSGSGGFLNP